MENSRINVEISKTSYGSLFKQANDKIKEALHKYYNSNLELNLGYEFKIEGNVKLAFITGFSKDEMEIPIFDNPVIIKDLKNREVVCVDLRKFITKLTEQPLYLKDCYKDKGSFEFIVIRALLTAEFINKNYGVLRVVDKNLCSAFSLLFSGLINYVINLNTLEKVYVEIALAYYFYTMTIEDEDIESTLDAIKAKISKTNLSVPLDLKTVSSIVDKLKKSVNNNEDFAFNIKAVLSEEKQSFVNMTVLSNSLNNMWFGPTGDSAMLIGLENYPTMVTLINSALNDKTYSRSRLSLMLSKYSNKIKVAEIEKAFELFLKERTI